MTIDNDDGDENPFGFNFSGNTAAPPSGGEGGGGDAGGCSTGGGAPYSWMILVAALSGLVLATRLRNSRA